MLKDSTQALLRPAQAFPSPSPTVSSNNGAPTPLGFLVFTSGPVCTGAGTPVPGFSEGSCVDRLRSTKTTARKGHHPPHWCPHRPHPRWSQQADGPRPFPSPLARPTTLVWSACPCSHSFPSSPALSCRVDHLPFPQRNRDVPISGSLHMLFPLPGIPFPMASCRLASWWPSDVS